MLKIRYILILLSFSISLSDHFDEAHSFEPKFVSPKERETHFAIKVDVDIDNGYYILSKKTKVFDTQIKWPDEGCLNSNGEDLVYVIDDEKYYCNDEPDIKGCCQEEGGNYNYGRWIKSETELLDNNP